LEQRRLDMAERMLREAVAVDPGHTQFVGALARLYVERRDYGAAVDLLERSGSAGRTGEALATRGFALQRLGRHAEAVAAYQGAVEAAPQPGTTWVGYAISLEALGQKTAAAQAYRRSLGTPQLTAEVRDYAERRIRALE
jgi:Flp pilus assembly protein TadD